jgi:hypothetical protein
VSPRRLLLTLVWLAHAPSLWAATVSLVQPPQPTPEVAVVLARLRGELSSIGLSVRATDRLSARAPAAVDATIVVVGDRAPLALDIWFVHPPAGQPEVVRIAGPSDPRNPSDTLALRAVEVLRANLFEVDWGKREPARRPVPPPPPPAPPPSVPPPSVPPPPGPDAPASASPDRAGIEVGATALLGLEGVGPAFLPTLRAGWGFGPRLFLQATLAGLGSRPTVRSPVGSAELSRQFGVLGVGYRLRPGRRLCPGFSLSFGALRTAATGRTIDPASEEYHGRQWSFLIDGGLGIALRLGGSLRATLGVHLQLAAPHVAIAFRDAVAATTGRPNVLFVVTMGAWR